MFTVDMKDLHTMDLGAHCQTMEEWNEEAGFIWQPAQVFLHGYYTRVVQDDGQGGLHIATYVSNGEGDLVSLRVYTDVPSAQLARDPAPASEAWVKRGLKRDHITGSEMWFNDHTLDRVNR